MTILKVKNIFYSFLAITFLAVSMISCQQEEINPEAFEEVQEIDHITYNFSVPNGMTESEANAWLENLNTETFKSIMTITDVEENSISSRGCYWTGWQNVTDYRCGDCSNNRGSKITYQVRYKKCYGQTVTGQTRNRRTTCMNITC